jgi:hypothetical protein
MEAELLDADRIAGMWWRSNLRAMNCRGMSRAALCRMRKIAMLFSLALLAVASRGRQEDVTPRATDLLRAKRLAEQSEQRLQLPAPDAPGWLRGGTGWDDDRGEAKHPPRRARRK